MTKKIKNRLTIGVLCLAAALLLVLYFVLSEKDKTKTPPAPTSNVFPVMTVDVESVNRLVLRNAEFSAEFVKEGDVWLHNAADFFSVKQNIMASICNLLLSNLNAFSKVENAASLAEYGLENPAAQLSAYDGEKLVCAIFLGNKLPVNDRYYCMFEGDDNVYVVSPNFAKYLGMTKNDFLENIELPSVENVNYLREIRMEGDAFEAFHAVFAEKNPLDYSGVGLFEWYIDEPLQTPWNTDAMSNAWTDQLKRYTFLNYAELIEFRATDMTKYGLDVPSATLTVRYTNGTGTEDNSYVLKLGNRLEDGSYYATVSGVEWIFRMDASAVKERFESDVFGWSYPTLLYPATPYFEEVTIVIGETEFVFVNEGSENEGENPTYSANGKRLDEEELSAWRTALLGLKVSAYKPSVLSGEEESYLTVACKTNSDAMEDKTFSFVSGEDGEYRVICNGVSDFVIDKRDVDTFASFMFDNFK